MTSEETQSAPGTTSKSDIQPPTAITPVAEGQRISNILQENSLLLVLSPQKPSSSPHPSTPATGRSKTARWWAKVTAGLSSYTVHLQVNIGVVCARWLHSRLSKPVVVQRHDIKNKYFTSLHQSNYRSNFYPSLSWNMRCSRLPLKKCISKFSI